MNVNEGGGGGGGREKKVWWRETLMYYSRVCIICLKHVFISLVSKKQSLLFVITSPLHHSQCVLECL